MENKQPDYSDLVSAIEKGNLEQTKELLPSSISDSINEKGDTAVHVAAEYNQATIINYLCGKGADVNRINASGRTPLHVACSKGHAGLVRYLVKDLRFDPLVRSSKSNQSLLHVALAGNTCSFELVRFLVEDLGFDPLDPDGEGLNSLHIASRRGELEVVKYFVVDRNCEPTCTTAVDQLGKSALQQPVHFAVASGKLELVKYLVDDCACDPSALDVCAKTPLHYCSKDTTRDMVQYLVEAKGCDPNHRSKAISSKTAAGRVPLHAVSFEGNLEIIKYFVGSYGCDPMVMDEAGITLVACAAQEGHLEVVRYLCSECGCDPNIQDSTGKTSLHYACVKGRLEVVEFLKVSCVANINVVDNSGESPILNAARSKQKNVVEYLLVKTDECDATVGADNCGKNAFHFVVFNDWIEIAKHLVKNCGLDPKSFAESGFTAVHYAAQGGAIEVLKFFVEEMECDVNIMSREQGNTGSTPLLQACMNNRLEVVKYLLIECKCGLTPSKGKELSPLHVACSGGHLEVAKYLIKEHNHPVEPTDHQGALPLHLALLNGHLQVSRFLMEECGSDPMKRTTNGATGIHAVCQGGHLDGLKLLIEKVDSLADWSKESGGTPLDRAAEHGHLQLVKYMVINNICDPRLKVVNGRSALHIAAGKGHLNVVEYLVDEVGCDVLDVDRNGQLALHFACDKKGNAPVIKYLLKKNKAQVSCKNAADQTPIQAAKKAGNLSREILEAFLDCGTSFSQLIDVAPKSCSFLGVQIYPFYSPLKIFCLGHTAHLMKYFAGEDELENQCKQLPVRLLAKNSNFLDDVMIFEVSDVTTNQSGILYDSLAQCEHPVFAVCVDGMQSLEDIQYYGQHYVQYIDHLLHRSNQQCQPFLLFALCEDTGVDVATVDAAYTYLLTLKLPRHKQVVDTVVVQHLPLQAGRFVMCLSQYINMLQPSSCLSPSLSALKLFVSQHFKDELYCSLESLQVAITDAEAPLPTEPSRLAKTLCTLTQSAGTWILIEDEKEPLKSCLILEHQVFLMLLQSEIVEKQPLISHSHLVSQSAGLDPLLFINALLYFNIISPIKLPLNEATEESTKLYFIPSLLPSGTPSSFVIDKQPNTMTTGWLLQSQPPNLFNPTFCLQLPAVAATIITSELKENKFDSIDFWQNVQGKLKLWKYGMHWISDKAELLVMLLKAEAVLLIVKTDTKDVLVHSKVKSKVIHAINVLNEELHPKSKPLEYLLHPSCLECFKVEENPALGIIPVSDIMSTLEKTQEMFSCSHDDLFGFDPLLIIFHTKLLEKLYNSAISDTCLAQDDLDIVSRCFVGYSSELQLVLNCATVEFSTEVSDAEKIGLILRTWNNGQATYKDMKCCFEQYSMFAKRMQNNIMVSKL